MLLSLQTRNLPCLQACTLTRHTIVESEKDAQAAGSSARVNVLSQNANHLQKERARGW